MGTWSHRPQAGSCSCKIDSSTGLLDTHVRVSQEQLQEQQRECLLLQGQLSSLQDAAQLRAAEAALAAMQLREAHAAAVGAVEEGDRRVLGAENGRAQVRPDPDQLVSPNHY